MTVRDSATRVLETRASRELMPEITIPGNSSPFEVFDIFPTRRSSLVSCGALPTDALTKRFAHRSDAHTDAPPNLAPRIDSNRMLTILKYATPLGLVLEAEPGVGRTDSRSASAIPWPPPKTLNLQRRMLNVGCRAV